MSSLSAVQREIVACRLCPRLNLYCEQIARLKRRAYRDQDYWGKPVPSFGDPDARLLILGLAPGAHGANRTGRVFTGDRSGELLYRVLHETGFASQPTSSFRDDGMHLTGAYIAVAVHCAPPGNKPGIDEIRACRPYLERELDLLPRVEVVIALGKLAFDVYLGVLRDRGAIQSRSPFRFAHGAAHRTGLEHPVLLSSYHPSQQNTSTGKLTPRMFLDVFQHARRLLQP